MNNYNTVSLPSASHGLHRHNINVPRLFTTNFYEHIPTYSWKFRKGNKINIEDHFFNRMNPLPVPALVTGKTNISGYFVPMKSIFKGWFDFDNKTKHVFSNGTSGFIAKRRHFVSGKMSSYWVNEPNLLTPVNSGDPYDVQYVDNNNVVSWYVFTEAGAAIYKVFRALGYKWSWYETDTFEFDATRVLAYIRIFLDHYFPRQYVGNSVYDRFMQLCELDTSTTEVNSIDIVEGVAHFMYGYYNDSIFCSGWDNPVGPNSSVGVFDIKDISLVGVADNSKSTVYSNPVVGGGTPHIVPADNVGKYSKSLSQFMLDTLQSLNNFIRRHNLGGNRWIEQFLLERGITASKSDINVSYKLNEYNIPFDVQEIESNSDLTLVNGSLHNNALGDLAGKAKSSSQGQKIVFKDEFDTDGVFMIIEAILPDNDVVCSIDPTNCEISPLDSFHASFDKQGVDLVPARVLYQDNNGSSNITLNGSNQFCFLDRYYQEAMDAPLVYGDYDVIQRGSQTLANYHTFRRLYDYISGNGWSLAHSYDFLSVRKDVSQYSRIFYTGKSDNIHSYHRFIGQRFTGKLPLGESFDWNDDEFNKQVSVITNSNVKQ